MRTTAELMRHGRRQLTGSASGGLDTEVLLSHVLGVNRAWLYANGDAGIGEAQADAFLGLIERRSGGEPVAYLTGGREFWSLHFEVNPQVLIPRPETELLVQTALDFIPTDAAWRVADLGTGSGAVAVAIALERPACEVHATDISPQALEVAQRNARMHVPGRVIFHTGPWLEPLDGAFNVLVSNPPYVTADDKHLEAGDCRFEPRVALTPGENGMSAIELIALQAPARLAQGGMLAFEHGFDQGRASRKLLESLGYHEVCTRKDLENRDRVSSGIRKNT